MVVNTSTLTNIIPNNTFPPNTPQTRWRWIPTVLFNYMYVGAREKKWPCNSLAPAEATGQGMTCKQSTSSLPWSWWFPPECFGSVPSRPLRTETVPWQVTLSLGDRIQLLVKQRSWHGEGWRLWGLMDSSTERLADRWHGGKWGEGGGLVMWPWFFVPGIGLSWTTGHRLSMNSQRRAQKSPWWNVCPHQTFILQTGWPYETGRKT